MSDLSVSIDFNDSYQVKSLIQSDIGVLEGFSELIEYCETRYPDAAWDKVRKIEIKSDITYLRAWLKLLLAIEPPSNEIKAFYFGIFNPVRLGQTTSDMYASGSTRFDLQNWDWACRAADSYWPTGRDSKSRAKHEIYMAVIDTNVAPFGEYVLCLGYASLAVKEIFAESPLPVVVGFDEGDMILVKT